MIVILHGDYQLKSRQRLNQLIKQAKDKDQEVIRLNGEKLLPPNLIQALESASFLGSDRLVVIEGLFKRRASRTKETLFKILAQNDQKNIVVWEAKTLTTAQLKKLPSAQTQLFKLPATVFKFLDSLQPGQPQPSLLLLRQALKIEKPELVFYLLARRVSQLIVAKDYPQGLAGQPWQKKRLLAQARRFSLNQLLKFHQKLLELDYQLKTSRLPLSLAAHLDLLILNL